MLPNYYKKSSVIQSLFDSLELQMASLSNEVSLTENQFFVILADRNLNDYEQDVGLSLGSGSFESRRSNVLSKLRGTGTTTKEALQNVVASFEGGEIEVIEYVSEYAFAIKFVSKKGTPAGLEDIKKVLNEIKPAHLEVRYIFTYRLWQDVKATLMDWDEAKYKTWDWVRTFEVTLNLNITDDGSVYFRDTNDGNAFVGFADGRPIAKRMEV